VKTPRHTSRRAFLRQAALAASAPVFLRAADAVSSGRAQASADEHCIVTANIRVPLPVDEASGNGWEARRDFCAEVIRALAPDIVCLQEALRGPAEDLRSRLGKGFRELGFHGPEMDARPGAYQLIAKNPILYSDERYELVAAGGFWLSETPHLAGTSSWGSARARHVNWVRLRDRASRRELRVLNTHLDHQSQPARERQLAMIVEEAAAYAPDFPQVLAGDFNLDAANPVFATLGRAGWRDAYTELHGDRGDGFTAHAYQGSARAAAGGRIDFILTRGALKPVAAEIMRDSRDGRFPSDHYFVCARLRFAQAPVALSLVPIIFPSAS
jgi:endonuclease/exonuclease/phosphatase family metal-dependent hydrolase